MSTFCGGVAASDDDASPSQDGVKEVDLRDR